jgi:hypothetical protein
LQYETRDIEKGSKGDKFGIVQFVKEIDNGRTKEKGCAEVRLG